MKIPQQITEKFLKLLYKYGNKLIKLSREQKIL